MSGFTAGESVCRALALSLTGRLDGGPEIAELKINYGRS
jgi:hypothetical protein